MSAPDDRPPLSAEDRAMHEELDRTKSTLHFAVLPDAWRDDADEFEKALGRAMWAALSTRPHRVTAPLSMTMAATIARVHGLTRRDVEAMARAAIEFAYID